MNELVGGRARIPVRSEGRRLRGMRRYLEIILYKAYADLRVERSRTYLGVAWWIIEPLMFMLVYWVVFFHMLGTGKGRTVSFLLIGVVIWQWFKGTISHGCAAVMEARGLIQQVRLPPTIFPFITIATDSFKFLFVVLLLVGVQWVSGTLNVTVVAFPLILLAEFAVLAAATLWLAAFVPFVPDLRFIAEHVLLAMMFLSGVFYDIDDVAGWVRPWFDLNPMALIIDQSRVVLLDGQWPDWAALLKIFVLGSIAAIAGAGVLERCRRHYPKLPR